MSLFREDPPFCLLSGLLERFCIKENGAYLINHIVYKKMRYYNYMMNGCCASNHIII